MTCSTADVLALLPGAVATYAQIEVNLQKAIDNAAAEVSAQLAALYPASADGPLLRAIVSYRAVANLLASLMSSNNENGETRLSEYYNGKAKGLIDGLLSGLLTVFDDEGNPIDTADVTPAGMVAAGMACVVYPEGEA